MRAQQFINSQLHVFRMIPRNRDDSVNVTRLPGNPSDAQSKILWAMAITYMPDPSFTDGYILDVELVKWLMQKKIPFPVEFMDEIPDRDPGHDGYRLDPLLVRTVQAYAKEGLAIIK